MTVTCTCREKGMYHLVADEGYHLMIPPSGYIYADLVCHESQIGRWHEVKKESEKEIVGNYGQLLFGFMTD